MSDNKVDKLTQTEGIQGIQGKRGKYGPQGATGATGSQGLQGKNGAVGSQGARGCHGLQGASGASGMQGAQGIKGVQGVQGTRGCSGLQGFAGASGMQGAQGSKGAQGANGLIGIQGLSGVQGSQGPKGRTGDRGEMGYQGDDGEIGIQGVTGEKGSVWVDGIRLDGYNTHLFEFDVERNKFVSKNDNKFNPADGKKYDEGIANGDLLYIRNGAVIAIWLDEAAYASIKENGTIIIDRLENGNYIETKYPAYYAGQKPLADVITPENDLDTVVELMYRDGAWYYSGGLLTPTITEDITVAGVELGNLRPGAVIEAGITLQELFTRLLVKEIDVHGVKPKSAIKVISGDIADGKTYEVGSSVSGTIGVTYTDGRFVGDEGYECNIAAECPQGPTAYYKNGTIISESVIISAIGEEGIVFSGVTSYGESEAKPKTNVGNLSSVKIEGGSVTTNKISIKGRYAMYYGNQTASTASTINDPSTYQFTEQGDLSALDKGWLEATGETVIPIVESTVDNPSFVIVVPSSWKIVATTNSLGQSVTVDTTWYKQNTIRYSNNGVETEYQVYVSPSTEASSYKNIILSK